MATLAFDYRFGDQGKWEITPSLGILRWNFGVPTRDRADQFAQIFGTLGGGVDTRVWVKPRLALQGSLRASTTPTLIPLGPYTGSDPQRFRGMDSWQLGLATALWFQIGSRVEMSLGAGYSLTPFVDGKGVKNPEHVIAIGSVAYQGLTPTPLFSVQLAEVLRLVAYGGVAIAVPTTFVSGWGTVGIALAL
jgi:hypothetical protein